MITSPFSKKAKANAPLTLAGARQGLFIIWLVGSFSILALFAAQTMFGVFGDNVTQAWGWLVPHLAPSVAVILSGYVTTALQTEPADIHLAKPWVFWMALLWSGGYLLLIASVIIFERLFPDTLWVLYENSNAFLGIMQGIASAFLAVFFISGQQSIDLSIARKSGSPGPMVPAE